MGVSDENDSGVTGNANVQGLGPVGSKLAGGIGHNRRALSNIDRNIIRNPPSAVNKRSLSERQAVCDKNPPIPVHRPITRKFAAQMASKQQCIPEGAKKPVQVVSNLRNKSEDCTIIDTDVPQVVSNLRNKSEDCTIIDTDVPMFVQHTEALMEEIYGMEEVEMEDVPEEPVVDIDSCDKKNPLAVVAYIDDLYKFYRKVEGSSRVSPNYMAQQVDINERMRGVLIDWLIEVHYKFELMDETLYLTVNLIDRFLEVQQVVRKKLQLVGVTAMLLACKYEEVSVPVVEDLILISDKAYSRKEVLEMEKLMVNTLHFNLSLPTPYVFMRRFLKAAQSNKKLQLLSFFIVELCLVEYEMLKFPYSLLAAAAIYTAQCAISGTKQWTKTSELHTSYSQEELLECSKLMVTYHQRAGTGKLTGVFRKYNTSKFGGAAKQEPASFLLEAS